MATAIFYASSVGNTEDIAKRLSTKLGDIDTYNICDEGIEKINNYEKIIFGVSTWGDGDLQDDWEDSWGDFCDINFSNKTIALFGLGDQDSYADTFVDGLGTMYEALKDTGANIIGFTSVDGFEHEESTAQIENEFVGLVLDEDNQDDLSEERIDAWIDTIKERIL
ncbi:MAG: flavodoxin [Campylobacteraceae bacterium]|nr:flavodoxin [Campylobacteraceae bacterium]